jgi:hypothetical protein
MSEIASFHKPPRPFSHERKDRFKEPFKYLNSAVRKLSGKKARDFDVLPFMIPVHELDRIIADDMNKVFLFSVIDTVQVNCGFLLS